MSTKEKFENDNMTNGIISLFIVMIYLGLIIFGLLSLKEPQWLKNYSSTGRISEAITLQIYGNNFLNREDYENAIIQYQKALEINPQMVSAHINLGVALKQLEENDEALKSFQQALHYKEAMHDVTYYNMAEIYQKKNMPEQATEYYFKAAERSPFPMVAYQKAGELLNNMAKWDQAFEAFNLALSHAPTMLNSYVGMLKRDQNLFEKESIKQEIQRQLNKGVVIEDLIAYDEKVFNDALNRDPHLAGIYNQFGYTFAMHGDFEKAIQYFELALQIKPDFHQARSNLNAAWARKNAASH